MTTLRNALITLLALAAAIWMLWPSPAPMPAVTFTLTDGRIMHSDELRGRPLLVNFWSLSCGICLRDMPKITRLAESLSERGLLVIGVAMQQDPPNAVIDSLPRLAPGFPIALDVHGELARAFGNVQVTPTTFLIGPDGNIAYTERGPINETRIRATLLTI